MFSRLCFKRLRLLYLHWSDCYIAQRECLQFLTPTRGLAVQYQMLPDCWRIFNQGRMIDHLRNSMSVDLDDLVVLILDKAYRLLELEFIAEIHKLIRLCPRRRQTMLFSATMTEEVDELVKLSLDKPLRLSADPSAKRPAKLTEVVRIRRMLALCSKTFTAKAIVFSETKSAAPRLKILFDLAGLKAAELHGFRTVQEAGSGLFDCN